MKKFLRVMIYCVCVFFLTVSISYAASPDDVLGVWQNHKSMQEEKAAQITIYKCGEKYCGKYTGMKNPDQIDENNKDEAKRGRKLMGSDLIYGVEYDDDGEYEDGKIYSAEKGKEFTCNMELKNADELYIEGCMAFLCGGTTWHRIK